MKKIILLLLLVTSCGMYNSDGVYVNRYNTQVQFDSIKGQYVIIKYIPIYKNMYNSQYYNHYYDMHRYPRTYRHQFNNYNNNSTRPNNSFSNSSSIPNPSSVPTPSVSTPSRSKSGKIQ